MYIKPCPHCHRLPIIRECVPYKNKTRRRMCIDSCYQARIDYNKLKDYDCVQQDIYCCHNNSFFVFIGEGDSNDIFKIWNECLVE